MFQKVNYQELNSKQKEIYNFQKIAAVLADYGFNCIKLSDDWLHADFLAYHYDKEETLKIQLKSRLTIRRDYIGKNLYIAFPSSSHGKWIVIPHDILLSIVEQVSPMWLQSHSWIEDGGYSIASLSKAMYEAIHEYEIG